MANTFHVALYVKDLEEAVARYAKMLGAEPAKVRPGYAKFEIVDPPLILSLNVGGEPGTVSHLGIRYPETAEVDRQSDRVANEGIETHKQAGVTCCYARSDKFWVRDADGLPWEMYTLLADVEAETAADPKLRAFLGEQAAQSSEGEPTKGCCVPASSGGHA